MGILTQDKPGEKEMVIFRIVPGSIRYFYVDIF